MRIFPALASQLTIIYADGMTNAFLSGIARVSFCPKLQSTTCGSWICRTDTVLEYLKGKTDNNECANLFKEYNQCLTVILTTHRAITKAEQTG
jgi:hypothetical protein